MSLRTAINRFRYVYRTSTVSQPRFLSLPPIPKPFPFFHRNRFSTPFQFHFSSSSSYSSSSSSNADDFPSGEFNFEPLTGFNKFGVRLKTMVALPLERVQYGSVLKITLQGRISDQLTSNQYGSVLKITLQGRISNQLTSIFCNSKVLSLPEICDNFLKAAYDPRVSAVYLHIHRLSCGWAKLDEIRRQISNFKKSGKTVVAYVPSIQPKEYYLACACDEIFAPPNGHVGFTLTVDDLSFDRGVYDNPFNYVKDSLNFNYVEDSSEARDSSEAQTALLHNIYSNWLDKVSSSRGKKREEVQNFINEGVYQLDKLKEEGFISSLMYDDEVITLLKEKLGVKSLPMISFRKYSKVRKWTVGISEAKEQIAIIRASGTMDSDVVTSNFIQKIDMVKESKKFKAVIVRIDSVGGDFHASHSMWQAVRSLASKKPVVASMSDVATNAGYYMAMGAGAIVAENLTLTGSIRRTVSQNFNHYFENDLPYDEVLDNVVLSRLMTLGKLDKMKKVAHGRIWTGKDAASHGLVDAIGGISCAIAIAKLKANIPQNRQVTLVELSRSGPTLLMLLRGIGYALDGDHQLLNELLKDMAHFDGDPARKDGIVQHMWKLNSGSM